MAHPLAAQRIVVTRPEAQSEGFIAALRDAGAVPILFPTIAVAPITKPADTGMLEAALRNLPGYDWAIFTSVNGVHCVADRMAALGLPMTAFNAIKIAAIGPATANALRQHAVDVTLCPAEYVAEQIATDLLTRDTVSGVRFLLLRADIARAALREILIAHGAYVDEIAVYRTVRGQPDAAAFDTLRQGADWITFTSSSTVRYFFDLLGVDARRIADTARIACIGPITAATARELGLTVTLVAEEYTVPGLLNAMIDAMTESTM